MEVYISRTDLRYLPPQFPLTSSMCNLLFKSGHTNSCVDYLKGDISGASVRNYRKNNANIFETRKFRERAKL
jgi:hypothetical protein